MWSATLTDLIYTVHSGPMPNCLFELLMLWYQHQILKDWDQRVRLFDPDKLPQCTLDNLLCWQSKKVDPRICEIHGLGLCEVARPLHSGMFYAGDDDRYLRLLEQHGWAVPMDSLPVPTNDTEKRVVALIECLSVVYEAVQQTMSGFGS